MKLLSGEPVAKQILDLVAQTCIQHSLKPGFAVVQIGDDPASTVYVQRKMNTANRLGFYAERVHLPISASAEEVHRRITTLNEDSKIHGIIVQLPLPAHLRRRDVIQWIAPHKDADGLHPLNVGLLVSGIELLAPPCTPYGIMVMLSAYGIGLQGKNVMVLNRSAIVGKPLVHMLIAANASVFWTHRFSRDHQKWAPQMDVLISATGVAGLIDRTWVDHHSVVIDVGISKVDGKIVGDVQRDAVEGVVAALTPVPGGVGPLTIAMLMRNVASLAWQKPIPVQNLTVPS